MNEEELIQEMVDEESETAKAIMRELETLAIVRTRFSSERSLLSWMRTSASLYSFGFAIPKFFDFLQQQAKMSTGPVGPRRLGLALICVAIIALSLAVIQHVMRVRKAQDLGLPIIHRFSLPLAGGAAMLAIGVSLLVAVSCNWSL